MINLNYAYKKLDDFYQKHDKRILNNEEIYTNAKNNKHISLSELKLKSDEEIELHLKYIKNTLGSIENSIDLISTNSGAHFASAKQFQSYNKNYLELKEKLPNFIKSVEQFDLKYPNLYKYKNRDHYGLLKMLNSYLNEGTELLTKNEFLTVSVFDRIKALNVGIKNCFNEFNEFSKDLENLKDTVKNSEHIISTITVQTLDELMLLAEKSAKQMYVTKLTTKNLALYKSEYETFKEQRHMLNIIQIATSIKNIEEGFLAVPKYVEKDIKDHYAEVKRKKEQEEEEERRRKKKEKNS